MQDIALLIVILVGIPFDLWLVLWALRRMRSTQKPKDSERLLQQIRERQAQRKEERILEMLGVDRRGSKE